MHHGNQSYRSLDIRLRRRGRIEEAARPSRPGREMCWGTPCLMHRRYMSEEGPGRNPFQELLESMGSWGQARLYASFLGTHIQAPASLWRRLGRYCLPLTHSPAPKITCMMYLEGRIWQGSVAGSSCVPSCFCCKPGQGQLNPDFCSR